MSLRERFDADLKDAMRAKDRLRLDTIRGVKAAVLNREVETGSPLDEASLVQVLRSLVKQRDDAISQYEEGGRTDLADNERQEKALLEAYLPAAPDAVTIEATVTQVIAELGASGMRDMGRVMKECTARLAGVGGKELSAAVKAKLS